MGLSIIVTSKFDCKTNLLKKTCASFAKCDNSSMQSQVCGCTKEITVLIMVNTFSVIFDLLR